jgi:hypothetical protein
MNVEKARECFNEMAATFRAKGMRDKAAEVEICREYFTNPKFRKAMEDFMWENSKFAEGSK